VEVQGLIAMAGKKLARIVPPRIFSRRYLSNRPSLDPVQEALLSEECLLVSPTDQVVGTASKRTCHSGSLPLHRAFSLFLFNERQELLLQQRSNTKITFPSMWTNTCCSHPLANEPEEMEESEGWGCRRAAQRKLLDELGVPHDQALPKDIFYLTRILYRDPGRGGWGEHELDYVLFLKTNMDRLTFTPNPEEVQAVEWLKKEHLQEFFRDLKSRGVEVTPWFSLISENLLPLWWDRLDEIEELSDHKTIHNFC